MDTIVLYDEGFLVDTTEGYDRTYKELDNASLANILATIADHEGVTVELGSYAPTMESISEDYHDSDVCMGELLADIKADGLTLEEAFELYIKAMKKFEGDSFFVERNGEDEVEL